MLMLFRTNIQPLMYEVKIMIVRKSLRNQDVIPENDLELSALRKGKWHHYQPEEVEDFVVLGNRYSVRSGLTFTPFANPTRCNAHCRFCSEELQRSNQSHLTAKKTIGDHDSYFEALRKVFSDLSEIKNIGLSLSGLELPVIRNGAAGYWI